MKLQFWNSPNPRQVCSRRGSNAYRPADVPPNATTFEYNPLPNSVVELLELGVLTGTLKITSNIPGVGNVIATESHVANASIGAKTQVIEFLQPVGRKHDGDGQAVSRQDDLQVPSVDAGDARLGSGQEHRQEIGPDGLLSGNTGQSIVDNRPVAGIGDVHPPVNQPGRDTVQQREVRSSTGNESLPSGTVLGREERGNEASGVSHPVYRWQQQPKKSEVRVG